MGTKLRALLVEDSEDDALLLTRELTRQGFDLEWERVDTAEQMSSILDQSWDVVLSDYSMPAFSAPAALRLLQESGLDRPFIVVSGTIGEDLAVEAMRAGAHDYLMKESLARLGSAIRRELKEAANRESHRQAEQEQEKLQAQLRQAQKMESIGRLAGGVAHDFNNILTVILSHCEMAALDIAAGTRAHGSITAIREAGERAAVLTRQLLAFSRQQALDPRIIDLGEAIQSIQSMLKTLLGEDVDLQVETAPGLGRVEVDVGQFEQVLMNLAVNARDAMPTGGRLLVEAENADVDRSFAQTHQPLEEGRYVMLAVTDTGEGMDEATRSRVFEPFFTTKEEGEGTGLGLSMVHGIVRQSRGFIWLYSEPGAGTTFKIYLPRVDEAATSVEPSRREPTSLRGTETILVVEDDRMIRVAVSRVLRGSGYQVLEAATGREALDIASTHEDTIHLLLTDVVMPRMSGRALAEQLLLSRPGIEVLYITGYTANAIVRHGILERGVDLLHKPFTPQQLLAVVRQILGLEGD